MSEGGNGQTSQDVCKDGTCGDCNTCPGCPTAYAGASDDGRDTASVSSATSV